MHFLSTSAKLLDGVVTRVLPGGRPGEAPPTQTLVLGCSQLWPLIGADAHSGLELGPPLELYADPAEGPAAARRPYAPTWWTHFADPVWDPFSSAVYMREGGALLRLSGDDTVTVVAGDVEEEGDTDGPGRTARFGNLGDQVTLEGGVVADGAGSLYVVDYDRIRKVQLPGAGAGERSPAPQTAGGGAAAAVPTTVEGDVLVSTLPLQAPGDIQALAFDGGGGSSIGSSSLVFATWNALYRLPLGDPTAAPSLLAERPTGGAAALDIRDIVLDGAGTMYVNSTDDDNTTSVWRVAADGTLTSIAEGLKGSLSHLAILGKDRLLLPELFKQAAAVVEAGVSPGTVVGLLLWAEARGPAFSELLSRLKAWYLANHEAVLQEAEEGMKQLAAQCPSLMVELMRGLSSRPAKRPRAS